MVREFLPPQRVSSREDPTCRETVLLLASIDLSGRIFYVGSLSHEASLWPQFRLLWSTWHREPTIPSLRVSITLCVLSTERLWHSEEIRKDKITVLIDSSLLSAEMRAWDRTQCYVTPKSPRCTEIQNSLNRFLNITNASPYIPAWNTEVNYSKCILNGTWELICHYTT